jgi:hypothetical protein
MAATRLELFKLLEAFAAHPIAKCEISFVIISSYSFLLMQITFKESYPTVQTTACLHWKDQAVMLYKETMAINCERHTEHINIMCGKNS